MQPTPSTQLDTRLAGLIWGEAKTGKTTWAMTLPGRKLLVNFDPDGYTSVAHRDDFSLLDLSQLPDSEQVNQAKKVGTFIQQSEDQYDSVIVDSLTSFATAALRDAVNRGVGKTPKFTPTLDAPGLVAYGARTNSMISVIDGILRATSQRKQHCFFITHDEDPEYDDDGKHIVRQTMMLPAKSRKAASIKVSEIYYISRNSRGERTVYLSPFGVITPMGSRIFDTKAVPKFTLQYDAMQDDAGQKDTLEAIFASWEKNGRRKLTTAP